MDIFKGLFRNFFRSNQPGRNYEDKTLKNYGKFI